MTERDMLKTIKKIVLGVVIGVAALILICRCFYTVDEQHNAVVTQFGTVLKVDTAGFYVKAP